MIPDAFTELYGIIGHPVRHSLSPAMHNAAFRSAGLNAVYLAFDVEDLAGALAGARALGVKGMSVTIPHKEAVMAYLDEVDETARRIGAVNTVVNRDNRLFGLNTDAVGAVRALEEALPVTEKRIVVLGAGGSARAVVAGLVSAGASVHVANRTVEKARALASSWGASWSGLDAEALKGVSGDVLVNTTSVGMEPKPDAIPVPPEFVGRFQVVMDIVYAPLKTMLLAVAEEHGAATVNGLRMLLHQAVAQFESWTGKEAPQKVMEEALTEAVGRRKAEGCK